MGNPLKSRLLIIAASARPWIQSAEIAGFYVTAFDFFSDWDSVGVKSQKTESSSRQTNPTLKREVVRLERFEDLLEQRYLDLISSCDYAILAGGMENQPRLIEALASRIPILGPSALQHDRMADTVKILSWLKNLGYQVPESTLRLGPNVCLDKWLRKAFRSSGGLGIRQAIEDDFSSQSSLYYYQKKISGESFSGFFISLPQGESVVSTALVGWTRQLVNEQWCGAGEFRYCGSIGPLSINESLKYKIEAIGQAVAEEYGVIGAWGIDFLVDGNDIRPVDFNVRLTASMELFEVGMKEAEHRSRSVVEQHALACLGQLDLDQLRCSTDLTRLKSECCFGKSIVFFDRLLPLEVTKSVHQFLIFQSRQLSELEIGEFGVADIPNQGEWVRPGQPFCTVLAREEPHRVAEVLRSATSKVREAFQRPGLAQ